MTAVRPAGRQPRVALDLPGLIGTVDLFRLSGSLQRHPAVTIWLQESPLALRSVAQKWFMRMRECGDDVRELIHDGCPVACVEDAAFGYVNSFKSHVSVGFFNGALLPDPAGLLQGSGKRMRHVKIKASAEKSSQALGDLINAAYWDIKARLRSQPHSQ